MKWIRSHKVQLLLYIFLPVITVFIAYSPIYNGPFNWDDEEFLVDWVPLHDPSKYGEILKGAVPPGHEGVYRPLRTLTEALSTRIFKINPPLYHIQAVIFHAFTTSIVFLVVLKLLLLSNHRKEQQLTLATIAAVIFGVHPVMQASVAFIQASFDTMGVTYAMISYFFLEVISDFDSRKRKFIFLTLCTLFALIAFSFFELTYTLPIIMFLTALLLAIQKENLLSSFKKALLVSLPVFISLVSILILRLFVLTLPISRIGASHDRWFLFLASTRAVFLYMLQTIFPLHLAIVHQTAPGITSIGSDPAFYKQLTFFTPQTIIAVIVLTFLVIVALKIYKQIPLGALGIFWFLIGLTPVMNLFFFNATYSERYLYFSVVGFALVGISVLTVMSDYVKKNLRLSKQGFLNIALGFIIVAYGIRTFFRVLDWTDPVYFWTKEAKHLPNIGPLHNNLGYYYSKAGQTDKAIDEFRKSIAVNPSDASVYKNLSLMLYKIGRYEEARPYAEQAVSLEPSNRLYFVTLQNVYQKLNDPAHDLQFYSRLIEEKKADVPIFLAAAKLAHLTGDTTTTEKYLRQTLELDPTITSAYINLGVLLNSTNRPENARDILESGKKFKNDNPKQEALVLYNLAISYILLSDQTKAKESINEAYQADPSNKEIFELKQKLDNQSLEQKK